MNILWMFGPSENLWNGVGQYSQILSDELEKAHDLKIDRRHIPYRGRSFKRYLYQFFVYPFLLAINFRKYDLLVIYQEDLAFLVPLARIMRKKVILIYHHMPTNVPTDSFIERLKILYLKIIAKCVSFADKIVCPSGQSVSAVCNSLNIPEKKFSVVYNCFDQVSKPILCSKQEFFQKFGLDIKNKIVFLNVGSDEARKNLNTLFKSLSCVENNEILIIKVGKSVVEKNGIALSALVKENNLSVSFLDFLSDDDLREMYFHSDFYVSPTIHEGFGRTVIEAQLAGLPVIASKIPVYDEIMGLSYFPVEDYLNPNAWASAIESVVDNAGSLKELGRVNAQRFTRSNVAKEFYKLITELE